MRRTQLTASVAAAFALNALLAAPRAAAQDAAAGGATVPAAPIAGDAADPGYHRVFIKFSGGLVPSNMAEVIDTLGTELDGIPLTRTIPVETVGLCSILRDELDIPSDYCTQELVESIVRLNAAKENPINPAAISAKMGVFLPSVTVSPFVFSRDFDLNHIEQKGRFEAIVENQVWSKSITGTQSLTPPDSGAAPVQSVQFQGVAWEYGIANSDLADDLSIVGTAISNPNLKVNVDDLKFAPPLHTGYSAVEHYANWCKQSDAVGAEGEYEALVSPLYDVSAAVSCSTDRHARVFILDQPIIEHPDLLPALKGDTVPLILPDTDCEPGEFKRSEHHGTLLAAIIASANNGVGFVGVSPHVSIANFPWNDETARENELAAYLEEQITGAAPQVFLFASGFKPEPKPKADAKEAVKKAAKKVWAVDSDGEFADILANDSVRFNRFVVDPLKRAMFFVASAGQQDTGQIGFAIHARAKQSPQNLGDQANILVVGACESCDSPDIKLWGPSNRSDPGRLFVNLLAPGGEILPTYVSESQVDVTIGGTSAAAAYAAGVAANTYACHFAHYSGRPERLKERLILASKPVTDEEVNTTITGGVVDPGVSLLDPTQTWLKLSGTPVRPVRFSHWCRETIRGKTQGGVGPGQTMELSEARRLTLLDEATIVYQRIVRVPPGSGVADHVDRWPPLFIGPLEEDGNLLAAISEADGSTCAVALSRLQDLFLDHQYGEVAACSQLALCGD